MRFGLRDTSARAHKRSGATSLRRPLLWTSLCGLLLIEAGCNTGAIAVGECREIERARCEALQPCGTIDDVEACRRFVRDSCLHGIAGPKPPTTSAQKACVSMITESGSCASEDAAMAPEECDGLADIDLSPIPKRPRARTVCDLAEKPWNYVTCDYVNEVEDSMGGGDG